VTATPFPLAAIARRLLPAALAILALNAFVPGAGAETVPARAADSFVDSIGVNTHTYYTDTPYYSQFATVKERLTQLGVRNIRENLVPRRSDQYQRLSELGAAGIKSTLILGEPREGIPGLNTLLGIVKKDLRPYVAAVEGPNEYDLAGVSNWSSQLLPYQEALYQGVKNDSSLSSLPVIGPSLVHWESMDEVGNISNRLDYGNIHSYPDGYEPESNVTTHLSHQAGVSAGKPIMATESGYHTAVNWTGSSKPVSEQAMAVYTPRMYLEYFRRGIARTFSYELLDEQSDPGLDDREHNFGLLRSDLSPKPAFEALQNTISILNDAGGSFAPGSLDYSIGGGPADLRQVLLQKRDGSFYLALWRASRVWDPVARTALSAGSTQVTVKVDRPLAAAELYEPNSRATPVSSFGALSSPLSVRVGPKVVILALRPAVAAPAPEPTPDPDPAPAPAPEPSPAPAPEPSPAPAPEPAPSPAPTPQPQPAPSPSPAPEPESAPAPERPRGKKSKKKQRHYAARKTSTRRSLNSRRYGKLPRPIRHR
jgi:hypothetical protein